MHFVITDKPLTFQQSEDEIVIETDSRIYTLKECSIDIQRKPEAEKSEEGSFFILG